MLSYLRNKVFPAIAKLLQATYKQKYPANFKFDPVHDENDFICIDNAKFDDNFLRTFRGGLGILVTFIGTEEDGFLAWVPKNFLI